MTGPKTNERPGTRAYLHDLGTSAYKVREVLKLIRGEDVGTALNRLTFSDRGAAVPVRKLLVSAISNAANNDGMDPNELFVSACYADESKTAGRFRPRARGRAGKILKRSAHITIIVSRLPEDKLERMRTQREAGQADRARRVAGGRRGVAARAATAGKEVAAANAADEVIEDQIQQDQVQEDQVEQVEQDQVVETVADDVTDAVDQEAATDQMDDSNEGDK
jgi:large subunit ribosomal protein L22